MQYLSAELFHISQQQENMRNAKAKANQLINHENNRAKGEEAREKREIALHEKQMELLALKIDYWTKQKQSEFPENK